MQLGMAVMKQNMFGALAIVILLVLVHLPVAPTVYAEPFSEFILIGTQDLQGIHFYSVNPIGEVELIQSLPSDFRIGEPDNTQTWFILEQGNFMVSPDQTQIAFTAQRGEENALFIYNVQQNDLQQSSIPADLKPIWSPDSSLILVSPCCEGAASNDDYIYDILLSQIIPVDTGELNGSEFQWVMDSTGLVYVAGSQIMFVSRDGETQRVLTDIWSQIPSDISSFEICDLTWSEASQRYYYDVGCIGGGEEPNEYLYSVDLIGNNRAETSTSLPSLYPEDSYVRVVDLHPVPVGSGVYITLKAQDGSRSPDGLTRRRILRLDSPGEMSVIYEEKRDESFSKSIISPDKNSIALVSPANGPTSKGLLQVIDLNNGQVVAEERVTPQAICDAQWTSNTTVIYSVDPIGVCDVRYSAQPIQVWQLNILTGTTHNVSSLFNGTSWILPTTPAVG
jgi:hypothetical protein